MEDNITKEITTEETATDTASILDAIDKALESTENGTQTAALDAEEAVDELAQLRGIIDQQNATIDRLAKQMEKMILQHGARLKESDGRGVEAFSVEPKLGQDATETITQLEDIVLGS